MGRVLEALGCPEAVEGLPEPPGLPGLRRRKKKNPRGKKKIVVPKIEDRRLCRRSFFESSKQRHPGASGRPPRTRRLCLGCPEIVGGLLEAPGCFCFENPDKGLLQNLRSSISERRPNKNHKPLINRITLYQCPPLLY